MELKRLAQVAELANYIGEAISYSTDVKQAESFLDAASSLVLSHAGEPGWTDQDVPQVAKFAVLACAARAYTNPDGWTSEAVDDWRGSGRKVEEAGLYLTASERASLARFRPRRPFGTVSTTRDPELVGRGFVPTPDGAPILWY